jgi:hypothetical protein
MWLNNERKYARKSLRNRSKTTAIENGAMEGYIWGDCESFFKDSEKLSRLKSDIRMART